MNAAVMELVRCRLAAMLLGLVLLAPGAAWADGFDTTEGGRPTPSAPPAASPRPAAKPARSPAPKPVPAPPPPDSVPGVIPNPLDMSPGGRSGLMLKNPDQINLLNMLAQAEIAQWAAVLKQNRSSITEEFLDVLGRRSNDALEQAVAHSTDQSLVIRMVDLSFRYALLADLSAHQIGRPVVYRIGLAHKFYDAGIYPMAIAICRNIAVSDKNILDARLVAGRAEMKVGDYQGALVDFEKAVQIDGRNAESWSNLGQLYLMMGNLPKAKEALQRGASLGSQSAQQMLSQFEHPSQIPPPSDMNTHVAPTQPDAAASASARGQELMRAGALVDAEKQFRQALQADVNCAAAHLGLGDLSFRKGDYYKAIDEYALAARYAPHDAEPLRSMGLTCEIVFDRSGSVVHLERSIECLRRAMQIKPNDSQIHADLDRILGKKLK